MLNIRQSNLRPTITIPAAKSLEVFHQMLPDFPGTAIEWVKHCYWKGPVEVPLTSIDTQHRATWKASHEPDKVKIHQELIQEGVSKPIILIHIPNQDKLIIVDAHHRFLAYEALHRNPIAYVGVVPADLVEAALTAHSHQYKGGSKLDGTTNAGVR